MIVTALNTNFDDESATVTFSWSYDNSANGVPATKFIKQQHKTNSKLWSSMFLSVLTPFSPSQSPCRMLNYQEEFIMHPYEPGARNLQGDSEPTFHSFIIPGIYVYLKIVLHYFIMDDITSCLIIIYNIP